MSPNPRAAARCTLLLLGLLATSSAVAAEQWVSIDPKAPPGTPASVFFDAKLSDVHVSHFDVVIHGFWQEDIKAKDGVTYQRIRVPGLGHVGQVGAPDLPAVRVNLAVMTKTQAIKLTNVTVLGQQVYKGIIPYPLGKPGFDEDPDPKRDPGEGDTKGTEETFQKDASIYGSTQTWPVVDALDNQPIGQMLCGIPGGTCETYPFDWNPAKNKLTVATSIHYEFQHAGTPYIQATLNKADHTLYEKLYLNASAVGSSVLKNLNEQQARYLIVTPSMYVDTLKPFIALKKAQGYQVLVQQLAGGENWLQILAYIKKWYEFTILGESHYCLLVGDTNVLPLAYSIPGSASSDDLYGSPLDLDLHEEVYVGRLSVDNVGDLGNQLLKIISYQTNPVGGGRYDRALLVAHKEGGLDKYIGAHEDVRLKTYSNPPVFLTRYGDVENNNAGVLADFNNEIGLACYRGHGSTNTWSGWNLSDTSFHKNDPISLYNAVQPVVWSISCTNHNIGANGGGLTDCIGEIWLEVGSGATASYGATRTTGTTANHELDRRLFEAVYDLGITTHAHAIAYAEAMMVQANPNTINAWAYNLLGDPSMKIRTEVPLDLTATLVSGSVIVGGGTQKLQLVASVDGKPMAGALVSLWKEGKKGDEIFINGYTNSNGLITLPVNPKSLGDIHFTVQDDLGNVLMDSIPVVDQSGCALAKNETYGEGKAGTNGVPALEALDIPSIGTNAGIEIKNALPGATAVLVLGLKELSLPFDGGVVLADPLFVLTLPVPISPNGTLTLQGPIPNNPALCGLDLYHQAWILDPGASGYYHLAMTNGLKRTFGA